MAQEQKEKQSFEEKLKRLTREDKEYLTGFLDGTLYARNFPPLPQAGQMTGIAMDPKIRSLEGKLKQLNMGDMLYLIGFVDGMLHARTVPPSAQ